MFLNVLFLFCNVILSLVWFCMMNQGRVKGEVWSTATANKLKPNSSFIAGRPKAPLLFWFFDDFRCGVPLFIIILVLYINIKIGKNKY